MNIVVIGNGFDIMSGLKTQYKYFYKYLRNNHFDFFNKVLYWFSLLDDSEESWSDFENNLRKISLNNINQGINAQIPYKSPAFDITVSSVLTDLYEKLSECFVSWITEINNSIIPNDTYQNSRYKLKEGGKIIFLNFNYTKTLEELYQVKANSILHIHGKVGGDRLIFGHGDETLIGFRSLIPEDPMSPYVDIDDNKFNYILRERIQDVGQCLYKDTKKIIKQTEFFADNTDTINKIYVIGHSYNDIDIEYYVELFKKTNSQSKWFFGYHSSHDYNKAREIIKMLQIKNFEIRTNISLVDDLFSIES